MHNVSILADFRSGYTTSNRRTMTVPPNGSGGAESELPWSLQAQEILLGALLAGYIRWADVTDIVSAGDLYRGDHEIIAGCIAVLTEDGSCTAGVVAVSDALDREGQLQAVGGSAYLYQLAKDTLKSSDAREAAKVIADKAKLRAAIKAADRIRRDALAGVDPMRICAYMRETGEAMLPTAVEPIGEPIDWSVLSGREPPPQIWWMQDWLTPSPHLCAGMGGIGKSVLWQTIGTLFAAGREFFGIPVTPLRVLIWSCEDSADEIWRRQAAICRHFGIEFSDFGDRLNIIPRVGCDNTLFEITYGKPSLTPLSNQLREQVNDLVADVLVIDNLGQTYGAEESNRHQVTKFVNSVHGMVTGRPFCPVFIGHVSRTNGSEFSGSAAWENACRMRWYLGNTLPDQKPDNDDVADPDLVYLCKRKSNYSAKDYRRLRFRNGLLVPEDTAATSFNPGRHDDLADAVVMKAFPKLVEMGVKPTDGRTTHDYLPTQIIAKGLAQGHTKKELTAAMNRLMSAGRLRRQVIGQYSNRSQKFGLVPVP